MKIKNSKWYLENSTDGYSLDNPFFCTPTDAVDFLANEWLTPGNVIHTIKTTLKYRGVAYYASLWRLKCVIDWDKREFDLESEFVFRLVIEKKNGIVYASICDAATGEVLRDTKTPWPAPPAGKRWILALATVPTIPYCWTADADYFADDDEISSEAEQKLVDEISIMNREPVDPDDVYFATYEIVSDADWRENVLKFKALCLDLAAIPV